MNSKMIRVAIVLFLLIPTLLQGASGPFMGYREGDVLFKVQNEFETIATDKFGNIVTNQAWFNSLSSSYGIYSLENTFTSTYSDMEKFYIAQFDSIWEVDTVAQHFRASTGCVSAWRNSFGEYANTPDDSLYEDQWALTSMNMEDAWDIHSGNSSVIISCIDTGIDLGDPENPVIDPHPDLEDNLWNDNGNYGHSLVFESEIPYGTLRDHGTKMVGLFGAVTNNDEGIAGVAGGGFNGNSGIEIMMVQISDFERPDQNIAASGITWAAENGADIVNCSFTYAEYIECGVENLNRDFSDLEIAIEFALERGAIVVASMGNNNDDFSDCCPGCDGYDIHYPASWIEHGVVSVAAIDTDDEKENSSNYGPDCVISAPGEGNWTTGLRAITPSGYTTTGETSAAAAHVSGVLGLIKSYAPDAERQMVIDILTSTAVDIDGVNQSYVGKLGAGKVDAKGALELIEAPPAAPTNLGLTGSQGQHPQLDWDANDEADLDSYKIYRKEGTGNWIHIGTVSSSTTTWTDGGVTVGDKFDPWVYYKITAVDIIEEESPYSWTVSTRLGGTSKEIAGSVQESTNIPSNYDLSEVYPNPFNPSTTIMYELPEVSNVSIVIYDMLGRNMWSSSESAKPAGYYSLKWDGQNNSGNQVTSGIYIISFSTPSYREVQKAVLIR